MSGGWLSEKLVLTWGQKPHFWAKDRPSFSKVKSLGLYLQWDFWHLTHFHQGKPMVWTSCPTTVEYLEPMEHSFTFLHSVWNFINSIWNRSMLGRMMQAAPGSHQGWQNTHCTAVFWSAPGIPFISVSPKCSLPWGWFSCIIYQREQLPQLQLLETLTVSLTSLLKRGAEVLQTPRGGRQQWGTVGPHYGTALCPNCCTPRAGWRPALSPLQGALALLREKSWFLPAGNLL